MKVGLLGRLDARGIGHICLEFARHMLPDRVLAVREPGAEAQGFDPDLERYPDALTVWSPEFDQVAVRRWLRGLDVVYAEETVYDWRLIDWARAEGVRTVVHINPEFYRHGRERLPIPSAWWTPTTWRLRDLPPSTRLVPVPVATDRFTPRLQTEAVFLHVAGHRAAVDRAGTTDLIRALRLVRQPMRVIVATQDAVLPVLRPMKGVDIEYRTGGVEHYWDVYAEGSVLVHPRRYGGLSLVNAEAAAAGLALVLSDTSPNRETWPGYYVGGADHGFVNCPAGTVGTFTTSPRSLAVALDDLVQNPAKVADLSAASITWAQEHSWEALRPLYWAELERVCGG